MPSFHYSPQSNTLEIPDIRQTSRIHPDDRDSVEVTGKKKKKVCQIVYSSFYL